MKVSKLFKWSFTIAALLVGLTYVSGGRLDNVVLLPDQGASWYYWKLPSRDFGVMISAWGFYLTHQLFIWWGIYKMQTDKESRPRMNKVLLIGNGVFILLHLMQTHLWYDGLAQDVPVFTSQGSVIGMLVLILIMEIQRRGILFGKPVTGFQRMKSFILKYHGYYIAWAITYTFWYHPMVNTNGHLVGFFYLFLLFIQSSIAYTKIHTKRNWVFILEVLVLFHATTVAIGQANNMWPMFGFGFAFIAVFTQIYGVLKIKWQIHAVQALYIFGALIVFGGGFAEKSIVDIHQITWIPVIEYALVFSILIVGEVLLAVAKKMKLKKVLIIKHE
ncbi:MULTISPECIES: hypothetical protein [unclassified Fusibacter]|uniref:hypothetical protein n=1 Tax=unclassified Fusibacter TaxID=2624464 RepID=UPI001012532E|nr:MULTISPECIES: hypothetical protein [unclassified Fusibacter]MCK8059117.1 hypothetical protein [Fusibacter sp. A2]NPE22526.1 hypothetical protein [Fusibacter sp. A1]RXV60629.1 hypothetical protein DWB64_11815 [Fusibacter sp. A1]